MSAEGTKHDTGKPPIGLVPANAIIAVARVLAFGLKKYGAHNWRKGIGHSRLYDAAQRHQLDWLEGSDKDAESGLHPIAHAICDLMMLYDEIHKRPGLDDRYKG